MMRLLYILLFLFPSCVKAQTGILGVLHTQAYPYTANGMTYTAAAASITQAGNLVGMTFTEQSVISWQELLAPDATLAPQTSYSGASASMTFPFAVEGPFFGFQVPITSLSGTLTIGVSDGGSNEFSLDYNGSAIGINRYTSGGSTSVASATASGLTVLGLSIADKSVTVWAKTSGSWFVLLQYLLTGADHDFKNPATLAAFNTVVFRSSGAYSVGQLKWGYLHGVGTANYSPVTTDDGAPLRDASGNYYILGSIAYASGGNTGNTIAGIKACSAAIFTFNPSTQSLALHQRIFINRGGVLYGENSGSVTYDRATGKFIYLIPNWGSVGDMAIQLYKYEATGMPSGTVVFSGGTILQVPTVSMANYDPDLKKINGVWYLGYTTTNAPSNWNAYWPVVATSTDLSTWSQVAQDNSGNYEGCKLLKVGGQWRVMASNFLDMRVYDLTLNYLGAYSLPEGISTSMSSAHPCIVPVWNGGGTDYWWLVFDGDKFNNTPYSWGRMHVLKGSPSQVGHDYGAQHYAN